jgi:hypothetical protein
MNKNLKTTLVTSILASGLAACGGSTPSKAPVTPPVQPPVVVVPVAGLTLEEVVSKFESGGALNLSKDVSGNVSYGSGNDISNKDFSFSVENSNGAKVCVNYSGQDSTDLSSDNFKFNDLSCGTELSVGGKADFDVALNNFNGYLAKTTINSPTVGSYDIYNGSETDSVFKINNGEVLTCTDSVSGSDSYVVSSFDSDSNSTLVSVMPGVFADESFAGESFSVSCDVTDVNGDVDSFSDIAKFDASFSSVPAGVLVDRIAAGSNSGIVDRNVSTVINGSDVTCDGVLENDYGTRACVKVGSDGDSISTENILVNDKGIDYSISGVNYMNTSEAESGLVSRLGTPVLKEIKNMSYGYFFIDSGSNFEFEFRNLEKNNSTCSLNSFNGSNQGYVLDCFATGNTDNLGFNKFEVTPIIPGLYSNGYEDENGDYNTIGNLNFHGTDLNTGDLIDFNDLISIEGNVNDDKIKFPNLFN